MDLLHAGGDGAVLERARGVLQRQVRQLSRIVEDLLDVGRIVGRKILLRRERLPVARVIESALETCREGMDAAGLEITVVVPPETLEIDADPVRIAQVFINILSNAAKFTGRGGHVRLDVEKVRRGAEPGARDMVRIAVRDTGAGIAPEFLPRIFDMFSQAENALGRDYGGLGVGLALARSLVEMHEGTIEARSGGIGKGSEFVVRLPLAAGGAAERRPAAAEAKKDPSKAAQPRRVLVIDDNQDQAESLAMLLKLSGHEVRVAIDGPSGLELAGTFRPEVAVIDVGLPGMSGHDLACRFRGDPALEGMLLVAQTGWGREIDRQHSRDAGFDHHLVKPFDPVDLERIIAAHRRR